MNTLAQIGSMVIQLPLHGLGITVVSLLSIITFEIRRNRREGKLILFTENAAEIILAVIAATAFAYFLTQSIIVQP